MIRSAFATLGVLLLSIAAYATPIDLGAAKDYNVFVHGNLGEKGSFHIVGRTAVGGDVYHSISFGDSSYFPTEWTAEASTRYFTYIGGTNATDSLQATGPGDFYIYRPNGEKRLSANEYLNNKSYVVYTDNPGSAPAYMGYKTPPADAGHVRIKFDSAWNDLTALSQKIANQAKGGTKGGIITPNGTHYALTANADAIFNLKPNEFYNLNSITTNGHTVLINVDGFDISYGSDNNIEVDGIKTTITRNTVSNVLFNFSGAKSIDLESALFGSILAPGADLFTNQNLQGQIIVNNLLNSGEIHAAKFTGEYPPISTPEPSTMLLMGSGLLGIWNLRRRMLHR